MEDGFGIYVIQSGMDMVNIMGSAYGNGIYNSSNGYCGGGLLLRFILCCW